MRLSSVFGAIWTNWITLLGSIIATVAGIGILFMLIIGFSSTTENPYLNLFVVIALPVVFAVGLLLIPFGLAIERRRGTPSPDAVRSAFELVFSDRSARHRMAFVAVATLANIGLLSFAGKMVVSEMDSPKFCGTSCHPVMQPEWEAYNRSPHSNVACVECHIGPGAGAEIKAKWNGVRQLVEFTTNTYHRPVPTPVADLRPARLTCARCHSPERFAAGRIKLFPHYQPDKDNTPKFNAMLLHIGGKNPITQTYGGIHWHVSADHEIRYEYLDPGRDRIGKVTVLSNGKVEAEYLPKGGTQKAAGVRTLDCIDCHNRPTHIFDATPKAAVDRALFVGALDPKMPFIAQVAIGLLGDVSIRRDQAEAHFQAALPAAYQKDHSDVTVDPGALAKASTTLAVLYLRNVYPDMNVRWNTYRSNLGHQAEGMENPGCFRCHDGQHETTLADGRKKKISQECDLCHTQLAFDENPAKFDETLSAMMPATQ